MLLARFSSSLLIRLAAGTATLFACLPAIAAEPPEGGAHHGNEAGWSLAIGAGAMNKPRYMGSKNDKTRAIPLLEASYRTPEWKVKLGEEEGMPGIFLGLTPSPHHEFGIQLVQSEGRKEKDDSHLRGLGNVKNTMEYGVYANSRFDQLSLKVSASKGASSGHGGLLLNMKAEYEFPLTESLSLSPGLGLTWANSRYMQRYFGVSAQQSASSGLRSYTAKSGLRDARVSLNLNWQAAPHWMVFGGIEYSRLQSDAKDSPIVQKATQRQIMLGTAYLW